ncbi:anti-sigma B factor antagonist [Kitasatospora sp. SolWspMP-SS2h]|uniref:STAS domain-containing protein n=1 Tax=Kitasatospora sp. SolWspMP-SS2h TaxID=1305729 RepID=UPI000DBFD3CB|nr:STAS domain-containing protein [Kitasatospora sp. SolWspMP-SS2h]RAJ32059.1 anti-sigma B factor antagonist [Kitasatospora sp. SolWspMP-SS2h]
MPPTAPSDPDPADALRITPLDPSGPVRVVRLEGDLDFHTAPRLQYALAAATGAGVHALVLELSELAFCDSVGLQALITACLTTGTGSIPAELAAPPTHLRHLIELSGLERLFTIHDTAPGTTA